MKLRLKVLFGYLLLAMLVVGVGFVGYRVARNIGQKFDSAINQTQPVLQALQDIRFHAVGLQVDAYRLALTPLDRQAALAPIRHEEHVAFADLDAATVRYRKLVAQYFPDEAMMAAEIVEKVEIFKQAVEKVHVANASHLTSEQMVDGVSKAIAQVLAAIQEAAAGELKEFAELQEGVDRDIAGQETLIFLAALAAVVTAIFGGISLSGRIARPVVALRDAARQLGAGQLDIRVPVQDRSEVGELAEAFNSMAQQLSSNMVSRDYVENIIDSMAEGLLVVNRDGVVERVNQAFRLLYRCDDSYAFSEHRLAEYFVSAEKLKDALSAPASRVWIEVTLRTADGDLRMVALSVARLDAHQQSMSAGAVVLVQDITERKRNEERLNHLALYDPLTNLPNRTLLLDYLRQSLSRQPWSKTQTVILFCDLDRFKFVNDTLGHSVGDMLLQRVADRLRACVRPGDVVARWSGDEFVILLKEVAQASDVEPLAAKLVEQMRPPIQIGSNELFVTISVGVSMAPEHTAQENELIKLADMAMYAAKMEGKDTYCFYTKGMIEQSKEQQKLEGALRHALQEGCQLQVHYQAQRQLTGPLIGFEALVRWQHPELGLISPASFLPTAEEAGLMAAIDETVMRMACGQARQWLQEGILGLRIAVNISNQTFHRGDLVELVSALLTEYALPPTAIEFELTEAIVMADIERSIRTMHSIRALGIDLSIDDFGTGYSSLAHLKRCPIQMLKIDRSFVMDVTTDPSDAAITEAIVVIAHKMGIQVIAEGVETQDQAETLQRYGCDAMQGYLLSKPIPADSLPAFLASVGYAPDTTK